MKQNEITSPTRLLDADGNVALPGWCRRNNYVYDRGAIKANPMRIKEWDFYQISDPRYTVQATVADISMGGGISFVLFDRTTGERWEVFRPALLTRGSFGMESDAMTPHVLSRKLGGAGIDIRVDGKRRLIVFESPAIQSALEFTMPQGLESLTMAVPFDEPGHFYLNQKINCMPVKGYVRTRDRTVSFDPEDAFGLLDWGRGVWPYKCSWYWGNGAYRLDGTVFGFEIGWGFGRMDSFTENTLFYGGTAHKLGKIRLEKSGWLSDWRFSEEDGRFEMTMTPVYDNFTSSRVICLGNICHQVHGLWNGRAVLDDGRELEIKDMPAFCEFSDNRW
ncbi:MAG: DUF2804 domain-containing protein [Clostridia bacterium]|nr:DUF2804 domain-containing protein [Clostridia bacterium]